MKNLKKIMALAIAVAMVLALGATAMAATGKISITSPTGAKDTDEFTYEIYKVFDAVASEDGISYSVMSGKTGVPDVSAQMTSGYNAATTPHFILDSAGNVHYGTETTDTDGKLVITDADPADGLSEAAIKAVAAYISGDTAVDTVTITGSDTADSKALENGYYYITTTTGSVVAITSAKPTAQVTDKNSIPGLDKVISDVDSGSYDTDGQNALAQVGTEVEFTVTITVGKGAVNYKFHDTMGTGLEFKGNDSVTVSGVTSSQYEILSTPETGDDLTITFVDGIAEGTEITITYKATVTSDALQEDPATNSATLDYGDSYSTTQSTVNVYNAKFTVNKKDGSGNPLGGAGFVIKNADGKYYKIASGVVSWVTLTDDTDATIAAAISAGTITQYTSDATTGVVPAFTGLADGTYTLIESTVPAGYNKAADSTFTIAAGDYTADNLSQSADVTNNTGSELPSTGGIGTTIFYIVGGILILGAGVLLITRKRMTVQ